MLKIIVCKGLQPPLFIPPPFDPACPPFKNLCFPSPLLFHPFLKVVSATFLLVCFLDRNKSTCETRKNVFYFTSKTLFVLEIIKF